MPDARTLTIELGGHWHGRYGTAACPRCQPERRCGQDALTLADGANGRLLANCKKSGCAFGDILAAAGIVPGDYDPPDPVITAQREAQRRADAEKRARQAADLWNEARPIEGTAAEQYLRGRGITCPLPGCLRFHAASWHGASAQRLPAMVARIDGADRFAAHRTFLNPKGTGKADVTPARAMLGAVAGGAVRLANGPGALAVAEGIETALSLASGLLRGPVTIWAALSTSGLRGLRLPDRPHRLIIATDGDEPGRAAGHALAERAAALGWAVEILAAPDGTDFNDILRKKAA